MKKKIIIIIVSIIGIILLDSVQALIFDNSPIIKVRELYNGGDFNYKDKGILVDTYCGINGNKDTVIKGFSYSILSDSSDAIYKEISSYVTENESEFKEIALKYLNDEKIEFPNRINSVDVFENEHSIVQFSVKSLSKQYVGFYYSVDDVPMAFQSAPIELKPTSNNVWVWKEDSGDNRGRTIRIKENWYYYEAIF